MRCFSFLLSRGSPQVNSLARQSQAISDQCSGPLGLPDAAGINASICHEIRDGSQGYVVSHYHVSGVVAYFTLLT
jgi:hypothetical protein